MQTSCHHYRSDHLIYHVIVHLRVAICTQNYCCLVSSFGLLVSFQLVIGILQHFSIVLVSYKSLVFLLVSYKSLVFLLV